MTPPVDEGAEPLPAPQAQRAYSRAHAQRTAGVPGSREWWEQMPTKSVRRNPLDSAAAFDFQVPEHLPSSPMCPANPKHPSGGTGLCVYHGRRRTTSKLKNMATLDGTRMGITGLQG